jgi:copper(I)-binding protein
MMKAIVHFAQIACIATGLNFAAEQPAYAAIISHAWAPPSLKGATTGVAYLTITSAEADRIVSAFSPVAKATELHTHEEKNGILRMRKLSDVRLKPGEPVIFQPGGLHIMLIGLKEPLKNGDSFPLSLRFASGVEETIEVAVNRDLLLRHLQSRGKHGVFTP